MKIEDIKQRLPKTDKNVVSVLSGGLDSSVATIILSEFYGRDKVHAISFDYGQKQRVELERAADLCRELNISHKVLDLSILGDIARAVSANIAGSDINMPTIQDVLGDPAPVTEVPNRNMIMYSIAAAHAQVIGANYIFCGLQVHDQYAYADATQVWVDKMNDVLSENRKKPVKIIAPFSDLSKYEELLLIDELGLISLVKHTLTCYNPDPEGRSCGICPSCAERIANFAKFGQQDLIEYSIDIPWDKIIGTNNV